MPTYLYAVVVNKYNTSERLDVFHIVSNGLGQATNIANHYVYEKDRYRNTPVEIVAIYRDTSVREIVNSEEDDAGIQDNPFDLDSNPDSAEVISFKHTCSNIVRLLDTDWLEVECPDCKEIIYREDIENVGGVWLYVGSDKNGKNR